MEGWADNCFSESHFLGPPEKQTHRPSNQEPSVRTPSWLPAGAETSLAVQPLP